MTYNKILPPTVNWQQFTAHFFLTTDNGQLTTICGTIIELPSEIKTKKNYELKTNFWSHSYHSWNHWHYLRSHCFYSESGAMVNFHNCIRCRCHFLYIRDQPGKNN